ncbi:MAG: PQQ-binding-like beta-propeller repeat protein, partial [Armatimonadota bacterium]
YWGVRVSDAEILWERQEDSASSALYAAPAVIGDAVVFGSRSNDVFRVHRATGKVQWTFATRSDVNSSPVINRDHVLFGSSDGNVYRVRLSDGKKVWSYDTGGPISASPAVGQRRLVIGNESGVVYCFG